MNPAQVHFEHAHVLEAFADFIASLPRGWLTDLSREPFARLEDAFDKLSTALENDVMESHVEFTDMANHAEKFKQASHVFNGLLLDVFNAYIAHDPARMLRHFNTFNRVVGEMNAPCPPTEDIREEMTMRRRACAAA